MGPRRIQSEPPRPRNPSKILRRKRKTSPKLGQLTNNELLTQSRNSVTVSNPVLSVTEDDSIQTDFEQVLEDLIQPKVNLNEIPAMSTASQENHQNVAVPVGMISTNDVNSQVGLSVGTRM